MHQIGIGQAKTFCNRNIIRYRHILAEIAPAVPKWNDVLMLLYERSGWIPACPRFFRNSLYSVDMLGCLKGNNLRLEGDLDYSDKDALVDWTRPLPWTQAVTTHESIRDFLEKEIGVDAWQRSRQYATDSSMFKENSRIPVRRLLPEDRVAWQFFIEQNREEGIVANCSRGSGSVVRDFLCMCWGFPIECYSTEVNGQIAGFISVIPMVDGLDEISTLFVDPQYRRKGHAHSLLSAATRDILKRGRRACYYAGSGGDDLHQMLLGLGYRLCSNVGTGHR